jgi:thiamine transporter ThiT
MTNAPRQSDRIGPATRVACFSLALICIYLGVTLKLDHPMQLTMDFLAPIPFLLLAASGSYRSRLAKLAAFSAVLLWGAMIAAPFVFPSPLVF